MKSVKHHQSWFLNRKGKKIYRVLSSGQLMEIKIRGKSHACYMHLCQQEMNLIYIDKN